MSRYRLSLFLLICFCSAKSIAQTPVIKGTVESEGERLPSATLQLFPDSIISTTDTDGRFLIRSVRPGSKTLIITYTGYKSLTLAFQLRSDTLIRCKLQAAAAQLGEIVVESERYQMEDLFKATRSGTNLLTPKDITSIPVLGGEADVIKTLQLLPGTLKGVEGSSDIFVRGGAADQNLVLLDGAPVYNTSHLFGFLSVFNPDMLDRVEAINGAFPASFGGRLSSILNIETKARVPERASVSGDVGLIASRLFAEVPIVENKVGLWVAGRRTYIDKVLGLVGQDVPYYFYDLNGKITVRPDDKHQIEFSHYSGEDILEWFRDGNNDGDGFTSSFVSGNNTQSFKWSYINPKKWSGTLSAFRTGYRYNVLNSFEENELVALSDISDVGASYTLQKDSVSTGLNVRTGISWTRHAISPSIINAQGTVAELIESSASQGKLVHETAAFAEADRELNNKLTLTAGLRLSAGILDERNYVIPEPRLAARYELKDDEALKFSYSRMAQYLHRISNSAASTPTDVWYTVTNDIKPQTSHQFSVAWQKLLPKHDVFISAESYYKSMNNLIGFEEGTNLFFNTDFESKLIQGRGRAYGFEFLVRKQSGKLSGWISYTLSWSWRQFNEIEDGAWFYSRYDRRHNGAVVGQYKINNRLSASVVWEFISGARFTPIIGQYTVLAPTLTGVDLIPIYSDINAVKLADTHRLDVGLKWTNKPGRKFQWHWFAGVYNAYNRANPLGINIEEDESNNTLRYTQPGLFGLLPFISYGFKF